jgi:hypothetical protein
VGTQREHRADEGLDEDGVDMLAAAARAGLVARARAEGTPPSPILCGLARPATTRKDQRAPDAIRGGRTPVNNDRLLSPTGWLVLGLPWPDETRDGWGECAVAIAPPMIPRTLVSKNAGVALDLATGLARAPEGPGRVVFFSDLTLFLDRQGKDWASLGIDYEAVIDELVTAPVPQLYLSLTQKAHAILCDASRQGMRLVSPNGEVEVITPQLRRDVRDAIVQSLSRDWPPYIQGLIDQGAIQTQ